MTTRARKERRATMYEAGAEKRTAEAERLRNVDAHLRHDWAFITQPGRIPARERMNRRDEKAYNLGTEAARMDSRAAGIRDQLDRSIYSDDVDAIERLRERIEGMEAERATVVDFNKAVRKKGADVAALVAALPEALRKDWVSCQRFSPGIKGAAFPAYKLSNLGAEIRRNRERLDSLTREASPDFVEAGRLLTVKYGADCRCCGRGIERGETATYYRKSKELACYPPCTPEPEPTQPPEATNSAADETRTVWLITSEPVRVSRLGSHRRVTFASNDLALVRQWSRARDRNAVVVSGHDFGIGFHMARYERFMEYKQGAAV